MPTHTCTLVVLMVPLGLRGATRSVAAIKAATTKATVVKNPKVFCNRSRELYMPGDLSSRRRPGLGKKG